MFVDGQVTKCLDIKKYSDRSQKQAVFFRNPYDSIPSAVFKARVDCNVTFDNQSELEHHIKQSAIEYLEAIKEAKANSSNIYLGKSEDIMAEPVFYNKRYSPVLWFGIS